MGKKILGLLVGWLKDLLTKPSMIAAVFAGVLIAVGVPSNVSHAVGDAAGSVASAIEANHAPAVVPPVVDAQPTSTSQQPAAPVAETVPGTGGKP